MGGSETYARELTRQLATTEEVMATAFVPANAVGFSVGIPERVVTEVSGGRTTRERLLAVAVATLRSGRIRRQMSESQIVHFPLTVPVPRPLRRQAVVQTLHDVQHLDLPELFSRPELAYRRHFYEGAARSADLVVTISEFAKRRMIELLGIPAARIRVAHLGVDTDAFRPNRGDRENFVLYPARGWRHKNHPRLISAMEAVRTVHPGMRLVLTGGGLDALGELPDWVERKGLVEIDELHDLYRRATVLAFPSLYEGFGLPPLEAMASGCPVAASDAGAIPEVCGDAAVLFDAQDPESIAEGILAAVSRSSELSARGLNQVRRFTWERCRDVHIGAYRELV